jgi:HD-GYP domain-containing protein (c-di-GMP phosphodiesterase class II)
MLAGLDSEHLRKVFEISLEIAEVRDLDVLLERVLKEARSFCRADAGSIYVVEEGKLKFIHAQNDTLAARLQPGKKLIFMTFSVPLSNQSISGYVALSGTHLNIEDVYSLPAGVPYSFDRHFDEISNYRTKSILAFPLKTQRGKIIGVLQMINARGPGNEMIRFDPSIEPLVQYFANSAATAIERAQLTRTTILRMISMAELRDPMETGAHVNRVGSYAVEIYETWAKAKGIPDDKIEATKDFLRMAAMLHDAGKVAISDLILKKPGKFTDEEFNIMKEHTSHGARLFMDRQSEADEMAYQIALNHHERWDGRGYPGYIDVASGRPLPGAADEQGRPVGKKGEDIPLLARICAVADVYDALVSRRVYKTAWKEDDAVQEIQNQAGRQFDPEVVQAFVQSLETLRAVARRYPDGG